MAERFLTNSADLLYRISTHRRHRPAYGEATLALEDIIDSVQFLMIDSQGFSFGGPDGPAEGPLWSVDPGEEYGGHLLFSFIHNNRRMRFAAEGSDARQ